MFHVKCLLSPKHRASCSPAQAGVGECCTFFQKHTALGKGCALLLYFLTGLWDGKVIIAVSAE